MKIFMLIISLLSVWLLTAQQLMTDSVKVKTLAPEIFTNGFIDIMNSGQLNAGARFIRLYIGEPGKFYLPLSLYGGVSNNTFQSQSVGISSFGSNDQLVNQYINPLSGLVNVSVEGVVYFKQSGKASKVGLLYHAGERVLTGYKPPTVNNPYAGSPVNFLNSFASSGLYLQTGAWDRNDSKNMGVFWFAGRYILCHSSTKSIKQFLPDVQTNGIYHGYSLGFGVEINDLVNIKVIFYKYIKQPEIDYHLSIYQFSFNYSFRN